MYTPHVVVLLAIAAITIGCNGDSSGSPTGCEPGRIIACACGTVAGTSTCDAEGRFGPCRCPGTVTWSPAELDFGEVPRAAARDVTLSLRNDGDQGVMVRSARLSRDTHEGFAIVFAPEVVPPSGGTALVVVSFRSEVPLDARGTLLLEVGGRDTAIAVPLSITVVGPALSCSPTTLDFGFRRLGKVESEIVNCQNTGVGDRGGGWVRPIRVVSDDREFTGTFSGHAYGPGERFTVEIQYLPADDEADAATLRLVTEEGVEATFFASGTSAIENCDLEVIGSSITGIPGTDIDGELIVQNTRSDVGCLLDRIVPYGCAPGFSLNLPLEPVVVLAGATLSIPFTFRAEELGQYSCSLRVIANDPQGREWNAVLEVGLSWSHCLWAWRRATLPSTSPSCGPSRGEVLLTNSCRRDLIVDELRFSDSDNPDLPAVGFSAEYELPATIPAHGGLSLPVVYDPKLDDRKAGKIVATLEVVSRLQEVLWELQLEVERRGDNVQSRISDQVRGGELDVLVVIDNGVGMAPESIRIVEELGPMVDRLRNLDFRLAVTTTGLEPTSSGVCPGGGAGGENGRFFPVDGSRPRVIGPDTPDARSAWEANLQVGACQELPARPFEAALRAHFNDANPDDFFRFDPYPVTLLLVFIGDRDDASPLSPDQYWSQLAELYRPELIHVVSIAGGESAGCMGASGESAAPAPRLHQFTELAGGGEYSICEGSWDFAAGYEVVLRQCFRVGGEPDDRNQDGVIDEWDLEVRIANVPVEPVELDGRRNWTWEKDANEVCFSPENLPPTGSAVAVEHLVCD